MSDQVPVTEVSTQVAQPTTPVGTQYPAQAVTQPVQNQQYVQPTPQVQIQTPPEVPEPTKADPKSLIGNTPLETSINVFSANTGVSAERFVQAVQNALQYDDVNLIDKTSLTQGLKGDKAAQAEALATAMFQHAQQERNAIQQQAYTAAGGKEQWGTAIQAFNTSADPDAKEYAQYLESTGKTDKAIKYIMDFVQGAGLVNHQEGSIVQPSGGMPNSTGAMTGAEFQKAVGELYTKAGNSLHSPHSPYSKELAQLQQRRELGKRQGL